MGARFTGKVVVVLGVPGKAMHAAAKAGLRAVASPGPTETPIIGRNVGQAPGAEDALRQMMIANTPMRRQADPHEIARAVLFLASGAASFITGIDLFVDGGVVEH